MSTYNSAYTGQQIDETIGKAHTHSNEKILNDTTANYTAEEKINLLE